MTAQRHTADTITDDALDKLYAELQRADRLASDRADRIANLRDRWASSRERLAEQEDETMRQHDRARSAETERDGAYRERAQLVAHLAALHPSHIGPTDPTCPDWAVVIVETPAGQMSWHIAPRDMDLFRHVPTTTDERAWDGHTTDEKYERLRQLLAAATA